MTNAHSIIDKAKERVSSSYLKFPIFKETCQRLQHVLSNPQLTLPELVPLILADPGLASQIIASANSPLYCGLREITTVQEAAKRLGLSEMLKVLTSLLIYESQACHSSFYNLSMDKLWNHSFCCAAGSRWIASRPGYEELTQEAVVAGLLHDLGKTVLIQVIEEVVNSDAVPTDAAGYFYEVLDCLHVPVGNLLMQHWHMPRLYCEVVAQHEECQWDERNTILTIVRLSNLTCKKIGIGLHHDPGLVPFATREAELLGLTEVALCELEICLEEAMNSLVY